MSDPAVTYFIDHDADTCGDVLPISAKLLIEIDERQSEKTGGAGEAKSCK